MELLGSLGKTFLSNGGFYSTPVNTSTKKLEGLTVLDESNIKEGFNNIYVCLWVLAARIKNYILLSSSIASSSKGYKKFAILVEPFGVVWIKSK